MVVVGRVLGTVVDGTVVAGPPVVTVVGATVTDPHPDAAVLVLDLDVDAAATAVEELHMQLTGADSTRTVNPGAGVAEISPRVASSKMTVPTPAPATVRAERRAGQRSSWVQAPWCSSASWWRARSPWWR